MVHRRTKAIIQGSEVVYILQKQALNHSTGVAYQQAQKLQLKTINMYTIPAIHIQAKACHIKLRMSQFPAIHTQAKKYVTSIEE